MKAGLELTSWTVCWSLLRHLQHSTVQYSTVQYSALRHLPCTGGMEPGLKLGSCTGDTTERLPREYGAQAICPEPSVVSTVVSIFTVVSTVSEVVGVVVATGS